MTVVRFKVPDVGEGLTEAELLNWSVTVGDTVAVNQTLCTIETAKAAVELPSPVAGVIEDLHIEEGARVEVGTVIVTFQVPSSATETDVTLDPPTPQAQALRSARASESTPRPAETCGAESQLHPDVVAAPAMQVLVGTGPSGLRARRRHLRPRSEMPNLAGQASENRMPIKGVRKAAATAMTTSVFTPPHVTGWLAVDITDTVELVATLRADPQWSGVRVDPMLFVAKALLIAVNRQPGVNTGWDEADQEIVHHNYVNLGIAVATPHGLLVPNIKNAGDLSLIELASAIEQSIDAARAGRTTPADMSGATITVTNFGALDVDAGTPILNPGEGAILAFGSVRPMPWVVDGQITIRQVTQVSLSYDHRLVDSELGSNVLTTIASVLTKPVPALLYT
ncbi:MAG: 2-oxo acid dehydrogenase subunit E2 [Mycobacterium sp.]|nr:2-oxo acid dehydrogenase subunit E2 [Mycobacterium sp.]